MAQQARVIVPVADHGQATLEGEWRAHANLARLKALHAEAAETANLANLLGRSIPVACTLVAAGFVTAIFANAANATAVAWGVLLLLAAGAIAMSWRTMIGEAFVRGTLRKFAHNLDSIMFYAGFAWGAGAYLALPSDAGIAASVIFSAGMASVVAGLLRARRPALLFVGPVALLAGLAPLLRTGFGDIWVAVSVVAACAFVAAAIEITNEMRIAEARMREDAPLPA